MFGEYSAASADDARALLAPITGDTSEGVRRQHFVVLPVRRDGSLSEALARNLSLKPLAYTPIVRSGAACTRRGRAEVMASAAAVEHDCLDARDISDRRDTLLDRLPAPQVPTSTSDTVKETHTGIPAARLPRQPRRPRRSNAWSRTQDIR